MVCPLGISCQHKVAKRQRREYYVGWPNLSGNSIDVSKCRPEYDHDGGQGPRGRGLHDVREAMLDLLLSTC